MARALVPFLEKKLGGKTRIVVVNKPGAGGEISTAYLARAKPDGYTVGFINVPGFVFIPMYKQASYKTDDVRIIARVVDDPAVLMVRSDAKFRTIPAILEALKKDPGSLSFATSGRGTSGHQALLKIESAANVKGTDIAFKGAGEFKSALIGGHVDFAIASVGEYLAGYGDMKTITPVAVMNPTRVSAIPDVPTIYEAGLKVRVTSERAIAGPKALPDDIANRFQQAIKDTIADPAFVATVKNDAAVLAYMSGAEFTKSLEVIREELSAVCGCNEVGRFMSLEMKDYYAARAKEYDKIYAKPERQQDLRAIEQWLPTKFAQCEVLEVAAGNRLLDAVHRTQLQSVWWRWMLHKRPSRLHKLELDVRVWIGWLVMPIRCHLRGRSLMLSLRVFGFRIYR
jgi:tripartite-type tricarboxylate transporter receptor subunit TctC